LFELFPIALAVDLGTVRGLPVDRERLFGHHCYKPLIFKRKKSLQSKLSAIADLKSAYTAA